MAALRDGYYYVAAAQAHVETIQQLAVLTISAEIARNQNLGFLSRRFLSKQRSLAGDESAAPSGVKVDEGKADAASTCKDSAGASKRGGSDDSSGDFFQRRLFTGSWTHTSFTCEQNKAKQPGA